MTEAGKMTDREWKGFLDLHPELQVNGKDDSLLRRSMALLHLEDSEILLRRGDECRSLPILLSGKIKVRKSSGDARDVVLYYIEPGGSCILSALGILNGTDYPAGAVCEEKATVLLIPSALVSDFVHRYEGWRNYIFALYNDRFHQLFEFIDQILFLRLDTRLAKYLLSRREVARSVKTTHQRIADDLGTSREVVSRLLKDFENRGFLTIRRGLIRLTGLEEMKKSFLL